MTPRVSLLLPNYNNERVLDVVLDRLARHTTFADVELVVVDDGSTDGSREILRAWRDAGSFIGAVRLVEQANGGAIAALNAALGAATGELCVQLDSDASVETPGWLEKLLAFMDLSDQVGVVTGKVVMDSGALHTCGVDVVGAAGWRDRPTELLEPVGRRRWHHRVHRLAEGDGGEAELRVAEVDAGMGCCMMYRRDDALAVGGYDTGFAPVWFDDVDLCLAIRRLGRKAFYVPDVRVVHHMGSRPPAGRAARLGRRAARRLPGRVRSQIEERLLVDLNGNFTSAQLRRIEHHYGYWREKWGWDVRNPDMPEVLRRWGDTEVCWAFDPARRAAGEALVREYEASASRRAG